jgi:DNA-binding MarR family transcriptional regulator
MNIYTKGMKPPLEKELLACIFRFKSIGINILKRPDGKKTDLSLVEIALMKGIADNTFESEGEKIQKALYIKKAAVSQMLGVLEQKGYIIREINPANRRKLILTLTKKGIKTLRDTEKVVDALTAKIIAQFGEKETGDFIRQFNRFGDVIADILQQRG